MCDQGIILGGCVIVAEKPSVARAISWALKDHPEVVVSSVRGHVYEVDLPSEFRRWSTSNLSSILDIRRLRAFVSDRRSYTAVKGALTQNAGKTLVVATDNDSEGDLIGREILNIYRSVRGASAPYARMRFNSTSPQDILSAWQNLEDGLNERWVEKAQFRQAFDLLIGAAFTRLLTLGIQSKHVRHMTSFGSCQTPTLYFVVKREEEIINFRPEKFWTLKALLETNKGERFEASTDRIFVPAEAKKMYDKVKSAKDGRVEGYSEEEKTIPRPYPLRTDDALRDLTKITGISASRLLSMMEQLYSSGYISYPRTETNRYSPSFNFSQSRKAAEDACILKGLAGLSVAANPRNGSLDDGAHPPIYPVRPFTEQNVSGKIWEYVARRFIATAFMDDAKQLSQHAEVGIETVPFFTYGGYLTSMGFFQVYPYFRPSDKKLPKLAPEEKLRVVRMDIVEDATKPPPRLTEADLLRLMEKNGIGTDSTRASFPTIIINRGYAVKTGKHYRPTPLGAALIEALAETDERLVTPDTRKLVEDKMRMIEKGTEKYGDALNESTGTYKQLLQECQSRIDSVSEKLAKAATAPAIE